MWLVLWAAAGFALPAASAPAPVPIPPSQGPISDFLRLRGKLPQTTPPRVIRLRAEEATIEVEQRVAQYTQETRETIVKRAGREETVRYTVTVPRFIVQKRSVAVKDCKFFLVSRDGKLAAIETEKAAARLKKPMAVLTGESAEIDPRHLELIKPGTLYLVLPQPQRPPSATPPPRYDGR
jgi:hypothetical protein